MSSRSLQSPSWIFIRNVEFRSTRISGPPEVRTRSVQAGICGAEKPHYDCCRLDPSPTEKATKMARYRTLGLTPLPAKPCPLDVVLRGAKNLLSLKVRRRSPTDSSNRFVPASGGRIELLKLKKAVIPPVSIHPLSIHAPQLQSLTFALFGKDELKA